VSLFPLVLLAVLAAGVVAAAAGARLVAREAVALTEAMRSLRSLQPALVALHDDADALRTQARRLGAGEHLQ
jgi:hypothetical protein